MSEEKVKDLSAFMRSATEKIISTQINEKPCTIDTFFSINRLEQFFAMFDKCRDYRTAFSCVSYRMYIETEQKGAIVTELLNEEDFISATDEELFIIISAILGEDGVTKKEYDKLEYENTYKRFYIANKNILDGSVSRIEAMFSKQEKQMNSLLSPSLLAAANQAEKISQSIQWPRLNLDITESMKLASTLQIPQISVCLAEIAAKQAELSRIMAPSALENMETLQSALRPLAESTARIMSAIDYSGLSNAISTMAKTWHAEVEQLNITTGLQSLLDSIPRVEFDLARIAAPLIKPLQEMGSRLTDFLEGPLELLGQSLAGIDFSLLTFHRDWDERHDVLLSYGWFYLNELPQKLIDDIYEKKETLSVEQVNSLIVACFRNERCALLKKIVKSWKKSRYFSLRNTVFHEALVNHSRRCYNTSVTLTTLHTEGVITDFVRLAFKSPKFHAEKALSDIYSYMEDMPYSTLTFSDWQIFDSVIAEIQALLTESFDLANPDAASNRSRHKIAHGHAVEKETEESSLKRFLYLNELFRIFCMIDKEMESLECGNWEGESTNIRT